MTERMMTAEIASSVRPIREEMRMSRLANIQISTERMRYIGILGRANVKPSDAMKVLRKIEVETVSAMAVNR